MKIVDGILCLEFSDAIEAGISENTLWQASRKNSPSWSFIDDPQDGRKRLIVYDKLRQQYKEKIIARFGNPYEQLARQPIRKMITRDLDAEKFYMAHRYGEEEKEKLPIKTVEAYTQAASVLNMLVKADADKKEIKKLLNLTITSFWIKVIEIIEADNIDLPKYFPRLREKMLKYKEEGYQCLIHKAHGQKNAAKVKDDVNKAVLLEMLADDKKRDFTRIARNYNKWAVANGCKEIKDRTVRNWYKDNEPEVSIYRNGNRDFYNKFGKVLHRKGPSAPMLLWSGDGNDWDMYFQSQRPNKKTGGVETYYFNQFVLVVVIDVYNRYPLGWAISKVNGSENIELIKAAYIDALHHVKELTGNYYLPHQLQSDRFGQAELKPFFQKFDSNFFFAAARAPRGKYIESFFGTKWHQHLREYPNYSGNNVKAMTDINPDRIKAEKGNFPHVSEGFYYAQQFISSLRNIVDDEQDGRTRQQVWKDVFALSDKSQAKLITDEQFLIHFGTYNAKKQTITNHGLKVQIANKEYLFEIPNEYYLSTVGRTVNIAYDPYDFSRVLVTDMQNLRFVAKAVQYVPAAKADYIEGDEARFFSKLHQKKQHMETIAAKKDKRENVLKQYGISVKAIQQSGELDKNLQRAAKLEGYELQNSSLLSNGKDQSRDDQDLFAGM